MSQKFPETASNINLGPCKRTGPDSNHGGSISKKAAGSVSENTGDTEEVASAIRERNHKQERERLERHLGFEKQQNVDLIGEYERKLDTQKKDYEAQLRALKEKVSLFEKTENERELGVTQAETKQKEAQHQNNSIIEEQSPGMANVVENDQALVENKVSQKDKKEADLSFFDSKFLDLARDRKPVPDNDSFLELAMLHVDEETDSDEYRDEVSSIESFGVDTEDMTEKEFSTYFELQNVLRRLNKRYPVDEEEQEKQEGLAETLLYCLHNIRNVPEPKEDDCLARVQDIRRSFDRADMLISTEPKKALEEFSLRETVKVKLSLEKVMDEMKQKRSDHCEVSKSVFRACNKMGAPKVKSSIEKFAQYVDFREKDMDAFWSIRECELVYIETARALHVVMRVEQAVRECPTGKEGEV
ncbi:hypothetical protein OXX80_008819 [Metschnikowia pulcherrima]